MVQFLLSIGLREGFDGMGRARPVWHYAKPVRMYLSVPFGAKELMGIAARGEVRFDCKHMEGSNGKLSYTTV
jgi:hypothetical protein